MEIQKKSGIYSFVGKIKGKGVNLSFDWSELGFANNLIPEEEEYVYDYKWDWFPIVPKRKEGVIYVSNNTIVEKEKILNDLGIEDTSLFEVEKIQTPKEYIFKDGDEYRAILTYKDTVVNLIVEIPEETKRHQIQVDTIGKYRRKLIRPKNDSEGLTGVYFKDLN